MGTLEEHRSVQAIAKLVLHDLADTITSLDSERTIADRAVAMLAGYGITETWYHDCPAFVLLGSRSCLSISGRDYVPSDERVGSTNVITVDLSPLRDGVWGDCARSFCIEHSKCVQVPSSVSFLRGLEVEYSLHKAMQGFVTPATSFAALFRFANSLIQQYGFENLDFLGNIGHSIESDRDARKYIESDNALHLSDSGLFTFEPHIRELGSPWGFKHENIYYFSADKHVHEL